MINWVQEKSAFGSSIPAWAKTDVPGFKGNYWAPHCIFMNNKYYLYYSCADGTTPTCGIGVASNSTLNPNSPNYKWTDLGRVAYATSNKNFDGIDPYAFRDTDKKVYLTYGGYNGGNAVGEVDTITGKAKNGFTKNASKGEGTALMKHGKYYYFIEQHGSCCSGVNSTYAMYVGRSLSPLGPFVDSKGVTMATSYGDKFYAVNGKYIGPGHFAHYQENGIDFVTYHYYDGNNGGSPTLGIDRLVFVNDWPTITHDWLDNGNYSITGSASLKSLEANLSTGSVSQNNQSATNNSQKWNFTKLGSGFYSISATNNKVLEVAGCANSNGSILQLGTSANTECQKFYIERTPTSYVLTPVNSIDETNRSTTKLVGIVGNATNNGTQIEARGYSGNASQKWFINPFGSIITSVEEEISEPSSVEAICFPNPFSSEIIISHPDDFEYTFYDVSGVPVEQGNCRRGNLKTGGALSNGLYVLRLRSKSGSKVFKVNKQ